MARAAATATSRTAPAPVPEEPQSVFAELWNAVVSTNPKFPPPQDSESDDTFLRRLALQVAHAPDETWEGLSTEAKVWYDGIVDIVDDPSQTIPIPDGYEAAEDTGGEDAGEDTGAEAAEDVVEETPAPRRNTSGLEAYRAKKAAEKAAAAKAAAPAAPARRTAAAAPPAPARRAAPPPPPTRKQAAPPARATAPAAPARRTAAPAPVPTRRAAPAPAAPARRTAAAPAPAANEGVSTMELIRQFIIGEYAEGRITTAAEICAYMQETYNETINPKTAAGTMSATKAVLEGVAATGHWK